MNQSTARSERITAILSTVVAVAILAAGVTAQQSHTSSQDELVLLESDLRFHLNTAFRHNGAHQAERLALLDKIMRAWRESPRSEQDRDRLVNWLLEATIRSMPGSRDPWPQAPEFGKVDTASAASAAEAGPAHGAEADQVLTAPPATFQGPAADVMPQPGREDRHQRPAGEQARERAYEDPAASGHPAADPAASTKINLNALNAQIATYNQQLDTVSEALEMGAAATNLDVVAAQLGRLESLTGDRQFLQLYYEVLSDAERQAVRQPRSAEEVLGQIDRLLNDADRQLHNRLLTPAHRGSSGRVESLRRQATGLSSLVP